MEMITEFLNNLSAAIPAAWGESTTMWLLFLIAAARGLCATATEWIPDDKLGGLAGIINFIGGNNRNATGSQ